MTARKIFTLGHSTLTTAEFIALLKIHGVEVVADVRRFPHSRRHPHFDRSVLSQSLHHVGLRYLWLGHYLGGYREGGYRQWMNTAIFSDGLSLLERVASRRPTAIMCAEKLFFRCHRRFIADVLVARGWSVLHILDARRIQPHRPADPGQLTFELEG